jgi:hypothetical protein
MTVKTQSGRTAGHYLVSEANKTRSRATIVVRAGSGVLEAGAVLALIPSGVHVGKYTGYNNDGTNISTSARAILFDTVDATSVDQEAVATVRDAEVHGDEIYFAGTEDTGDKEAAYADLATHGIIVRFEERVT